MSTNIYRENPLKEERRSIGSVKSKRVYSCSTSLMSDAPNSLVNQELQRLQSQTGMGTVGNPPAFGRVDFVTDEDDAVQTAYIGTANAQENGIEIVDYRNPFAQVFFKNQDIVLSTGVKIVNQGKRDLNWVDDGSRIDSLLDSIGRAHSVLFTSETQPWDASVIGIATDEPSENNFAQAENVSAKPSTKHDATKQFFVNRLKARRAGQSFLPFVESLQPDQYDIITDVNGKRLFVIQGPAGSGKTGCALMRAANLHYRRRNASEFNITNLEQSGDLKVLIVSKNSDLLSYVDGVLPALGEQQADRITIDNLRKALARFVNDSLGKECRPSAQPLPKAYELPDHKLTECVKRIKATWDFIREDALTALPDGNIRIGTQSVKNFLWKENVLVPVNGHTWSRRDIQLHDTKLQNESSVTIAVDTLKWFNKLLACSQDQESVEFEGLVAGLAGLGVNRIRQASIEKAVRAWYVSAKPALERLRGTEVLTLADTAIETAPESERPHQKTVAKILRHGLSQSDALSVATWYAVTSHLRGRVHSIVATLEGSRRRTRLSDFNHIIVDEAQELSLDDLLLLDTVLPHHAMVTLCGDLYQRQNEFGLKRWESVTKSMRGAIDIQSLKVNYRSTYEINTVGRAFMPAAESSPSPNRGKQPVAVELREIGRVKATERVAELVQRASLDSSNQDRIGVIWMSAQAPINVPSLGKMADLASQRKERTDARIIGGPVADLGGLEYDHAIILIDDIPDTRESRRQLYVAVTRARRELTLVFCKGTPNWVVDVLPARVKVVG